MRWRVFLPLLLALAPAGARAAEVIPPAPAAYCNDYARLLKPQTVQAVNAELDQFERATSNQVVVAIYPAMQSDSSIEDYTVRVAQSWRVGQAGRKNGAVMFVFAKERNVYIQAGYGLEPVLTDATCKRIIDNEIVPRFKAGDFDGGIQAGVAAMLAAARGEYSGTGRTVADSQDSDNGGILSLLFRIVLPLVLVIVWSMVQSRRHVVYGSGGRSALWSGLGPMLFMGGGFRGGGFGGGGGGFGGGFSGGGGSFGGGGAGGHW